MYTLFTEYKLQSAAPFNNPLHRWQDQWFNTWYSSQTLNAPLFHSTPINNEKHSGVTGVDK